MAKQSDQVATLPSKIVEHIEAVPGVRVLPAPLPPVEVSPHLFWHQRTEHSPLRAWLRRVIKEAAAEI